MHEYEFYSRIKQYFTFEIKLKSKLVQINKGKNVERNNDVLHVVYFMTVHVGWTFSLIVTFLLYIFRLIFIKIETKQNYLHRNLNRNQIVKQRKSFSDLVLWQDVNFEMWNFSFKFCSLTIFVDRFNCFVLATFNFAVLMTVKRFRYRNKVIKTICFFNEVGKFFKLKNPFKFKLIFWFSR